MLHHLKCHEALKKLVAGNNLIFYFFYFNVTLTVISFELRKTSNSMLSVGL